MILITNLELCNSCTSYRSENKEITSLLHVISLSIITSQFSRPGCVHSHLARHLVADGHYEVISELHQTQNLTAADVQSELRHQSHATSRHVRQTVTHWQRQREISFMKHEKEQEHQEKESVLPWDRKGSLLFTSKQSITLSPWENRVIIVFILKIKNSSR